MLTDAGIMLWQLRAPLVGSPVKLHFKNSVAISGECHEIYLLLDVSLSPSGEHFLKSQVLTEKSDYFGHLLCGFICHLSDFVSLRTARK